MCNRQILAVFAVVAFAALAANSQTISKKFDFGPGKAATGRTQIQATDIYSKEKGYGFEPGATVTCSANGGKTNSGYCSSDKPFYFSAAVPEGNYRVTITFGGKNEGSVTTVKAELRRLMIEKVETQKGKFATASFTVNIRTPMIAGGGEVKLKDREKASERWAWDEKLTLEFNNSHPAIDSIEIEKVDVPTIFLLGDSTVCDQPSEPYASWGQMLTRFFKPDIAIASHAESGESLNSSYGAKRLAKVLTLIKKDDYVLLQFGHNDEKEKGDGVGAFTTYKASLKKYIAEIRAKGGIPVLITPMHRRTFDTSGQITNSHGDYPEAVRQAAKETNAPLIDLTEMSKPLYEALGPERSKLAFKDGDATHHNNYGSYELAKCIIEGIKANKLGIVKYLMSGLSAFDPAHPDSLKKFALPASPSVTDVKLLGN